MYTQGFKVMFGYTDISINGQAQSQLLQSTTKDYYPDYYERQQINKPFKRTMLIYGGRYVMCFLLIVNQAAY